MKEVTDKSSDEELESEIKRIVHNINDNPTNEDDLINNFSWMGIGEKDLQEWKSSYPLFVDTKESLMMRKKYSHLTYVQKVWLYSRYETHGEDVRTICQKYGISASKMKSILKIFEKKQEKFSKTCQC